jgi:hypothetical protein
MMGRERGSDVIQNWPEESREAAQLVIDEHGEPHEVTDSMLVWHHAGPRERIVATRMFFAHNFPARTSMRSSLLSTTEYRSRCVSPLAKFDGSVVFERTAGQVSARCHDEQANFLALT